MLEQGHLKVRPRRSGWKGPDSIGFGRREWLTSMPQIPDATADQLDSSDLISFLKAILDGRYRRGVRCPKWFLFLVALFGNLSGSRSSRDLEPRLQSDGHTGGRGANTG